MAEQILGVQVQGTTITEVQGNIQKAEDLGIQGVWMTAGGASLDSMTCFAASAASTTNLKMGTSIVPTYPRHPLVMAAQAQVVAQLAPGRFRLGVGPSHRPTIEGMGIDFNAPLGHLREYIQILKNLLQNGSVDFDGKHYQARATIPEPLDVAVMGSALSKGSFELLGGIADGAISWLCPAGYLRDVALPAMRKGAKEAGRPAPPLIAHAAVCVNENPEEVRSGLKEQFGHPRLPFYQNMMVASGYPEATNGVWSDAMADGIVISGDEEIVAQGIRELFAAGATEVLASPVLAGKDKVHSLDRTMNLLGQSAATLE